MVASKKRFVENLQLFAVITQALLVLCALWYSWETREMRMTLQQQNEMHLADTERSVRPHFIPVVVDENGQNQLEFVKNNQPGNTELIESLESSTPPRFTISIQNESPLPAMDLVYFFYDQETKSFLIGISRFDYFKPESNSVGYSAQSYETRSVVLDWIADVVGRPVARVEEFLPLGGRHYVVLIFRDQVGVWHLVRRPFTFGEHGEIFYQPVIREILG